MATSADPKLRAAIDEAIGPLIGDHRKYLYPVNGPLLPVSRADLHYIFDQYSTQLLDFSGKLSPVGHCHPFVTGAIREHMDYYIRTTSVLNDHVLRWPVEYARDIVDTFTEEDEEPIHKVIYTEGEREAVRIGIEVALAHSNRGKISIVDTGIHDWYSEYVSMIPIEHFFIDEYRWHESGVLLISLVTADGTVLDKLWVQKLVDVAKQNGVPVVVDESLTGFGRFGTLWGQQAFAFDADVTVLGGPVGGGLALGAVVAPAETFTAWNGSVSQQSGSPVACAAGAATLKAVNPGVVSHVAEAGATMAAELDEVIDQFSGYIVAAHGEGLWRTIEFQSEGQARQFEVDARKHGLLVPEPVGSSVTLTPPLIASEQEISRGVDLIAETLLDWGDEYL